MPTTFRWTMARGHVGQDRPFTSCADLMSGLRKLNRGGEGLWRAEVRMADGSRVIVRPKG